MKQLAFILFLAAAPLGAQSHFTKVIDPANPLVSFTNTQGNYKGCAWIDLDHDNWPDAFVSQKFLFRNLRNGNFEMLGDVAGVTLGQAASGSSWGDLDNDGDLDCITSSVVSGLHYNLGNDTFELKNESLPLFENYRSWDCSMADADNNGRLDLFFAHARNFPPGTPPQPCKFYLQQTDGTFVIDTSYEFGVQFEPYTIPIWTDYDLDGDMDLFIGTGPGGLPGMDYCYRNMLKENGVFTLERLTMPPFNSLQDGQVYNAIDFDNDGDFDICLTNYAGAPTRFYVNTPAGYVATSTPFTLQAGFLANAWGDVDNDGDLDVLITRDGTTNITYFQNQGGSFSTSKIAGVVNANTNACGLAFADYDNDGDLDFYVNGAASGRSLFRNDTLAGQRKWVQFTLEGVQSNRSAIGALIRIKATINGQPVWQIREVLAHNSFQSQHDLRQHFGLNDAITIDSLVVRWPSGLEQIFTQLSSNQFYRLREGENIGLIVSAPETTGALPLHIQPNPASREFRIQSEQLIHSVEVYDSTGKAIPVRFEWQEHSAQIWLLGQAPAGMYTVRALFKNGQTGTAQLMKI